MIGGGKIEKGKKKGFIIWKRLPSQVIPRLEKESWFV
jgi:hypothetical protein